MRRRTTTPWPSWQKGKCVPRHLLCANGNLTLAQASAPGTGSLPTIHYSFDALNREISCTDPLNHTWSWGYNSVSDVTSATDPLTHTTVYAFDSRDREISATDPLSHTVAMGYDLAGNETGFTDGIGRVTHYTFDAQNRIVTQTDPRGGVITLAYDLAGQTASLTDPVTKKGTRLISRGLKESRPLFRSGIWYWNELVRLSWILTLGTSSNYRLGALLSRKRF